MKSGNYAPIQGVRLGESSDSIRLLSHDCMGNRRRQPAGGVEPSSGRSPEFAITNTVGRGPAVPRAAGLRQRQDAAPSFFNARREHAGLDQKLTVGDPIRRIDSQDIDGRSPDRGPRHKKGTVPVEMNFPVVELLRHPTVVAPPAGTIPDLLAARPGHASGCFRVAQRQSGLRLRQINQRAYAQPSNDAQVFQHTAAPQRGEILEDGISSRWV